MEPASGGEGSSGRAVPEELAHRARLLPEGGLPAFLGLPLPWLGRAVLALVARMGPPESAGTLRPIRPDDPRPPGWDPRLDEASRQQRGPRGDEQQGQGNQPSRLRLPETGELHDRHLARLRRPAPCPVILTFWRAAQ